jgi:pentatricopeptide repeat protein
VTQKTIPNILDSRRSAMLPRRVIVAARQATGRRELSSDFHVVRLTRDRREDFQHSCATLHLPGCRSSHVLARYLLLCFLWMQLEESVARMRRALAAGAWPGTDIDHLPAAAAPPFPHQPPTSPLSLTLEGRAFGLLRLLLAAQTMPSHIHHGGVAGGHGGGGGAHLPLATGLLEDLCRHAAAPGATPTATGAPPSLVGSRGRAGLAPTAVPSAAVPLVDRSNPYFGACATAVVDGCLAAGRLDDALRLFREAGPDTVSDQRTRYRPTPHAVVGLLFLKSTLLSKEGESSLLPRCR